MTKSIDPIECPQCRSVQIIPILYGLPGAELGLQQDEGKLKLGGCCIAPESPNWHCKACGHEWIVEPGPFDWFDEEDEEEVEEAGT